MSSNNYIPRKDKDLLTWTTNFLAVLASILPRIEFPAEEHAALTALLNTFRAKLAIADAPATRTKAAVQDKNDARDALVEKTRQSTNEYLTFNHRVTNGDRDNLGLPIHKKTRTDAPVATDAPDCDVNTAVAGQVTFYYYPKGGKRSSAKPDGQHGAEFAWAILEAPTTDWNDLTHSSFDTDPPLTLKFEGPDRGKTLYYAIRWENTRGLKGPWSPIVSVIIP
ncbi:MAG: hypothetical protein LBG31_05915 [Prevotellaceae bacterium]|nr:hypothetical protein [Prevotellaceae bacterium]